jgi:regulatory protein
MKVASIEKIRRKGMYKVHFVPDPFHNESEAEDLFLSKEVIIDHGLRTGDEISYNDFLKIKSAQAYHDGYLAAMRLINYRMRTRAELTKRLQEKRYPQEVIAQVVGKLSDLGLVDDEKYADLFVSSKKAQKPMGKRELEKRLREKGIRKETIEAVFLRADNDQYELAMRAAESKIRSLKRFEAGKGREKLVSFLARRGFEWEVIKQVVKKFFDDNFDERDF